MMHLLKCPVDSSDSSQTILKEIPEGPSLTERGNGHEMVCDLEPVTHEDASWRAGIRATSLLPNLAPRYEVVRLPFIIIAEIPLDQTVRE